ncbi:MAG: DnaT-like ssDNA-binding domain-containing protein, partial [Pseudomonas sp.]
SRQEQAAAECVSPDQRFAMFALWVPDAKSLSDQIAIAGLPVGCVPDEAVRKFKGYHCAKPNTLDSNAGWCYRLVQWVKRERVQAAGRGQEPDFNDTSWGDDLGGL